MNSLSPEKWADLLDQLLSDKQWWDNRRRYAPLVTGAPAGLEFWLKRFAPGPTPTQSAQIDRNAHIEGLVVVAQGATILAGAVVEGPVYIGTGCEIGPNCYIRPGSYVGSNCHVGQGAEVTEAVLLDGVKMYHFSYVGYSIVGRDANLGAGCVTMARRFDDGNVTFRFPAGDVNVGPKGGALLGDRSQLGCGTLVYPGRQVGPNVTVGPFAKIERNQLSTMDTKPESRSGTDQETASTIWSTLMQAWDSEANRFWVRSNVFLIVNGGLIAFSSSERVTPLLTMATAVFGVSLCVLWHRVNAIGKYYLDRWKTPIKDIEAIWAVQPVTTIDRMSDTEEAPLKYQSSTTYMKWVIRLVGVLWLIILGYSIWEQLTDC